MNKNLSLALLVIGLVLLVIAVIASDSISSDCSRFFSGEPSEPVWVLIGGGIAAIGGLGGLSRASK